MLPYRPVGRVELICVRRLRSRCARRLLFAATSPYAVAAEELTATALPVAV
jgi:hypothetical protein